MIDSGATYNFYKLEITLGDLGNLKMLVIALGSLSSHNFFGW